MQADINQILHNFLSNQNSIRKQAQSLINSIPQTHFLQGINAFILTLNHQNPQISELAALLLKKKYLDDQTNFNKIPPQQLTKIIDSVKGTMNPNRKLLYLKRCCDILVKVYTFIKNYQGLFEIVKMLASVQNQVVKITLMYLIQISCQYSFNDKLLSEYSQQLRFLFQKFLQDPNIKVRGATFKSLIMFLFQINSDELLNKFSGVFPTLIKKTIECIKEDIQQGNKSIGSLCDLIDRQPKFIKPASNDLIELFTQIMQAKGLCESIRIQALTGIWCLSMANPASVRKSSVFKQKTVQVYMMMLAQIKNYPFQQWALEYNQQVASKNYISIAAQQNLQQIVIDLGCKFLMPLFIPYIMNGINSEKQEIVYASLMAISNLSEGSSQHFKNDLKGIMELIFTIKISTPKIIAAVLVTLALLCQEYTPDIQKNYHKQIVSAIQIGLNHQCKKVVFRAVQCISNFTSKIQQQKQIVQPYVANFVQKLTILFEQSYKCSQWLILGETLNSLNNLSLISKQGFSKYYDILMPGIKGLIQRNSDNTNQQNVKNKAIQCLGYLLSSIKGQQKFNVDCDNIMKSLISIQSSKLYQVDDHIHKAIYTVYEQVSLCLEQGFSVYCQYIIPRILQSIELKFDVSVIDQTETSTKEIKKNNKLARAAIDLRLFGGVKNIVLNTGAIQQKIQGSHLLLSLIQNMKTAFFPYIQMTIQTICKFFAFTHSRQVRETMICCVKPLVEATPLQKKPFLLKYIMENGLQNQLNMVIKGQDGNLVQIDKQICLILQQIQGVVQFFNPKPVNLYSQLNSCVSVSDTIVKQIYKQYEGRELDETEQNSRDEQIQEVQQIYGWIEKIIKKCPEYSQLLKAFPKDYEFE